MLIITSTASIINNKFAYGLIFIKNTDKVHSNKLISSVIKVNLFILCIVFVYFVGYFFVISLKKGFSFFLPLYCAYEPAYQNPRIMYTLPF